MAVALASRSARARSDDTRAIVAERQHQAVLRAHAPRLARRLQRTFEKLRDSFIHTGAKAAGDDLALTYSTPDYDAFRRELNQVLQTEYISIGTLALDAVETQLGVTLAFDLNERIIRAADIGNRVKSITDDTRDALRNTIQRGIDDGSHPSTIAKTLRDQLNGWAGLEDLTRSRAYTIARTETANAYNVGAILGYRESGIIGQVRVIDGPSCGWLTHTDPDTANGKIVSLDEAQANPISHPNCVRAFAPVAAGLERQNRGQLTPYEASFKPAEIEEFRRTMPPDRFARLFPSFAKPTVAPKPIIATASGSIDRVHSITGAELDGLEKLSPEVADALAEAADGMYKTYGGQMRALRRIEVADIGENTFVEVSGGVLGEDIKMTINSRYATNLGQRSKECSEAGWFVGDGTAKTMFTHEFGHVFQFATADNYGFGGALKDFGEALRKLGGGSASDYGATQMAENFAEAWAEVHTVPRVKWSVAAKALFQGVLS